jgi:thioredoxin-like negative regulator of GroEL
MIIGFFADRCGPCRCIPGFERAAQSHREIEFGRVDTRVQLALAERFQLAANPSVLVVRNGEVVASHAGPLSDEDLEQLIADAGSDRELSTLDAVPLVRPQDMAPRAPSRAANGRQLSSGLATARIETTQPSTAAVAPAASTRGVVIRPGQA